VQHAAPDPIVKGRHLIELGVRPGPAMGEILRAIYEKQLDGAIATLDQGLGVARATLASRRYFDDNTN
jgi:tRNA nucleotidyltransferase (CCA-adding enzyme)